MKIKSTSVTKEVTWDMAHRLARYNGPCANLHGHTYKLQVTVRGKLVDGMVVDFNQLKRSMEAIKAKFDHKCVLEGTSAEDIELVHTLRKIGCEYYIPGYRPTAENMVAHIANMLIEDYHLDVECVRLWETPTSFAEVRV